MISTNSKSLPELYNYLRKELEEKNEICSKFFSLSFDHAESFATNGEDVFDLNWTQKLQKRKEEEQHYHSMILNGLFHKLNEIKFYSKVDLDTRRLIFTNDDCLSSVQILIREDIHLNVYFRSSDLTGALPVDLEFLSKIPMEFINFLHSKINQKTYKDITEKFNENLEKKKIKFNIGFGSLHKEYN